MIKSYFYSFFIFPTYIKKEYEMRYYTFFSFLSDLLMRKYTMLVAVLNFIFSTYYEIYIDSKEICTKIN